MSEQSTIVQAPDQSQIGRLRDISVSFGDVQALKAVSLDIHASEILAIVGENGAGKTTLMNVLFGLQRADSGSFIFNGNTGLFNAASEAIDAGFGMVHQHFMLYPRLSVIENILTGAEGDGRFGFINFKKRTREVQDLISEFGFTLQPETIVAELSVAARQQLEIIKMIYRNAEVIILDEPTAVLTPQESESLFAMLDKLKADGKSVIIITHKLDEVIANTDRVVVMRGGEKIAERTTRESSKDELARLMVGRDITPLNKVDHRGTDVVLQISNLNVAGNAQVPLLSDVNLTVRAGEIIGVAGVSGNGQKAFVDALTGLHSADGGSIQLCGQDITHNSIEARREAGLCYLAEDRMSAGLAIDGTVAENIVASREQKSPYSGYGFLNFSRITALARDTIDQYQIRTTGPRQRVSALSGGNKQKIVVGRELGGTPKLIIAENPCWGVDIGAINFIHQQLLASAERGAAVIFVSAELEELFDLSDRLLVFYQGAVNAQFDRSELDTHAVGMAMSGVIEAESVR